MASSNLGNVARPLDKFGRVILGDTAEAAKTSKALLPTANSRSMGYVISAIRTNIAFPQLKQVFLLRLVHHHEATLMKYQLSLSRS